MRATPQTVLIVDDDATLRRALESALVPLGYRVFGVGDPDVAYQLVAAEPIDAILLDAHLAALSGLALYLVLVHRWPALEGRIAIMTGDAGAADVQPWLQAHRCPFLLKPFRPDLLVSWLDATLRPRHRKAAGR
jgi:DNA-binding response OmpR family regulator